MTTSLVYTTSLSSQISWVRTSPSKIKKQINCLDNWEYFNGDLNSRFYHLDCRLKHLIIMSPARDEFLTLLGELYQALCKEDSLRNAKLVLDKFSDYIYWKDRMFWEIPAHYLVKHERAIMHGI